MEVFQTKLPNGSLHLAQASIIEAFSSLTTNIYHQIIKEILHYINKMIANSAKNN